MFLRHKNSSGDKKRKSFEEEGIFKAICKETVVKEYYLTKNLEEKDGQTQLLCYVSLIRACNKVL